MRLYLAAPIFAEWNREYNLKVANRIKEEFPNLEMYVPQLNASINNKKNCATAEQICQGDFNDNLDHDDIVIALVDGDTPGIGTTLEIGYFARICQEEIDHWGWSDKKIIALYTDSRECSHTVSDEKNEQLYNMAECQYSYLNLLLVGCIKRYGKLCYTIDEVIQELHNILDEEEQLYLGKSPI